MAILENVNQNPVGEFYTVFKEMILEQRKPAPDKRRHAKLEAMVNFLFARLNNDQKVDAIIELAKEELVPESWIDAQKIFNGTFTKIF